MRQSIKLPHSLLWFILEFLYSGYNLHLFYLLKICSDGFYVFHIMNKQLDVTFKYSVFGLNENLADVNVQLICYDVGHLMKDTHGIYTLDVKVYREVQCLACFPLYGQKSVAEACLQLGGYRALTLMDDDTVVFIAVS